MFDSIFTAETIARKVAYAAHSVEVQERSRLPELLWFIEARIRRAGGTDKAIQEFVDFAGERLMPPEFLALPVDECLRFSAEDVFLVWNELPKQPIPDTPEIKDLIDSIRAYEITDLRSAGDSGFTKERIDLFRTWLKRDLCISACAREAKTRLTQCLRDNVSEQSAPFPIKLSRWGRSKSSGWELFPNFQESLYSWINAHAERTRSQIAQTRVTELVAEALSYADRFKVLVLILGDSRWGKTESANNLAEAYPGKWRVVRTPANGGLTDLLRAIAESINFDLGSGLSAQVKERLRFVIRNAGIGFIFDESQFLLPANFSATTAPARLNFVRTEIVDAGIPCILVATQQSHKQTTKSFTKKTQYAMEQWLGRVDQTFICPTDFTKKDMLSIARLRLPGISEKSLRLIIARAMQSEQFIHAMTAIARRAKWLAKDGEPTQAHIDQASDEFVNGVRCRPVTEDPVPLKIPSRETQPIGPAPARQIFPSGNISEEIVSHV